MTFLVIICQPTKSLCPSYPKVRKSSTNRGNFTNSTMHSTDTRTDINLRMSGTTSTVNTCPTTIEATNNPTGNIPCFTIPNLSTPSDHSTNTTQVSERNALPTFLLSNIQSFGRSVMNDKTTDLEIVLLSTSTLSIKPLSLSLTEMCRGSYPISIIMFPGLILGRRKYLSRS